MYTYRPQLTNSRTENTNVVKLYRQIELDTEKGSGPQQHAYYSSGIGTHAKNLPLLHRVEKAMSDLFDMALAWLVFIYSTTTD